MNSSNIEQDRGVRLNPTLWRTCRVLANNWRLEILRHVFAHPGDNVKTVAESLKISQSLASQYLRNLNSRGLISSEKYRSEVFYSPKPNITIPETKYLLNALEMVFFSECQSNSQIIRTLTGFTHPRRLKIMAILGNDRVECDRLIEASNISFRAFNRHMRKLIDRGIVIEDWPGDQAVYRIAISKDILLSTLLCISLDGRQYYAE